VTHPFNAEMRGFTRLAHEVLCRVFEYRDIVKPVNGKDSLYLRRFYVWQRKLGQGQEKRGALFLHALMRSDNDRHCHDHPWAFWTLCLWGGYDELLGVFGSDRIRGWRPFRPGQSLSNPAAHVHKVKLRRDADWRERPCWTLVKVGPACRVWGFHTAEGFVAWQEYLGLHGEDNAYAEDVVSERTEERR